MGMGILLKKCVQLCGCDHPYHPAVLECYRSGTFHTQVLTCDSHSWQNHQFKQITCVYVFKYIFMYIHIYACDV